MPRFRLRGLMALVAGCGIAFALLRRIPPSELDWALAAAWPSAIGGVACLVAYGLARAFRGRGLSDRRRSTVTILTFALAIASMLAIWKRYEFGLASAMIPRGHLYFETRSCPDAALRALYSWVGALQPACFVTFEPVHAGPDRLLLLDGLIAMLAGAMGYLLGLPTLASGRRGGVSDADTAASPRS